ncbi:HAMP domain-containing sensor histidine kinase [Elioraea sp.]|uniref:sensor histidine kinase n=1 Tax=Elioraea sp. TaxID=2185103 RepID=UPI0021DB90BD|nr:ATP-binding protein [Elioraea sp.]GIX09741.1 MAG: two-component sensor histidine kinase [Elioraea sp.]
MSLARRSFAVRVAVAAAAVMLVLTLLGSGLVWLRASAALRQQLDIAIAGEAEGFAREYEALGLGELAASVEAYSRRRGPLMVALLGPSGQTVAGRMPAAPRRLQGFADMAVPETGQRLRALGAVLPGGFNLILATDLAPAEEAARALAWTLPIAGGSAALLALALGFLAARGLERRLARATDAAQRIMDGDLSHRLPLGGRGDEFDRLTGAINLLLARIEALVTAQRQVTDDIAHDLRSPLARLRQTLEGALARPRDAAEDARVLEGALAELDTVLATFAALLRIARAEAAGREGFARVDLSALAAGLAEAYGPVAEEAGRRFETRIAPGITAEGDAMLLRQAIANLLDNALAHGGPTITLELRAGPMVTVTDDGPGIPVAEREAVVRRFYRRDASRGTPGAGLGLALVAATAKRHGGRFRLADGPDGAGITAILDLTPQREV